MGRIQLGLTAGPEEARLLARHVEQHGAARILIDVTITREHMAEYLRGSSQELMSCVAELADPNGAAREGRKVPLLSVQLNGGFVTLPLSPTLDLEGAARLVKDALRHAAADDLVDLRGYRGEHILFRSGDVRMIYLQEADEQDVARWGAGQRAGVDAREGAEG